MYFLLLERLPLQRDVCVHVRVCTPVCPCVWEAWLGSCTRELLGSAGQLVETTAQGRPGAALVKQWSLAELASPGPHPALLGPFLLLFLGFGELAF